MSFQAFKEKVYQHRLLTEGDDSVHGDSSELDAYDLEGLFERAIAFMQDVNAPITIDIAKELFEALFEGTEFNVEVLEEEFPEVEMPPWIVFGNSILADLFINVDSEAQEYVYNSAQVYLTERIRN